MVSLLQQVAAVVLIIAVFFALYPWQPKLYSFLAEQCMKPQGRFGRTFARYVLLWQGQEGAKWVGEQMPIAEQMLEVGCGSGTITRVVLDRQIAHFKDEKHMLLCIDASDVLVEATHEHFTIEEANQQIYFQKSDFTRLQPRRRSYDVVYTYDTLHVFPKKLKSVLKIMSKFLLKGGKAYLCFRNPDTWPHDDIYKAGEEAGIYKKWTVNEVHSLFLNSGFHDVSTRTNLQADEGKGAVCVFGTYKKKKQPKAKKEK